MGISGTFLELSGAIMADLAQRLPEFHKARREGIGTLVSVMLNVLSPNLNVLASGLPRDIGSKKHRYQYIDRILGNGHIDCDTVMKPYATDIFSQLTDKGQTLVLMMDQSKVNDPNQVLMVSVAIRERALPVAWRVRETKGNIGFATQEELLDAVKAWIPEGTTVLLAADRFYGTAQLVKWCQDAGWSYRIRLKGNLTLQHQGGEITTGEAVSLVPEGLEDAELYGSGVVTNIGILDEPGHPEPWIIAMDARPGKYTTLDYAIRWGIEPLYSDLKSRGFDLAQSRIQRPDKMERLLLVMALAAYWAVSCGAYDEWKSTSGDDGEMQEKRGAREPAGTQKKIPGKKNFGERKRKNRQYMRSLCSLFTNGLRFIIRCLTGLEKIPRLWEVWIY